MDVIAIQNLRLKILYEIPILYAPAMFVPQEKGKEGYKKEMPAKAKKTYYYSSRAKARGKAFYEYR